MPCPVGFGQFQRCRTFNRGAQRRAGVAAKAEAVSECRDYMQQINEVDHVVERSAHHAAATELCRLDLRSVVPAPGDGTKSFWENDWVECRCGQREGQWNQQGTALGCWTLKQKPEQHRKNDSQCAVNESVATAAQRHGTQNRHSTD